ncbi:hypothetical protein ACPCKV_19940 [Streptomyces koyangensis]|uniref:hypothetical protein n=1 Tax=Streptomyces koyangensis TaxID=188770 RepID=UPI003C2FF89D
MTTPNVPAEDDRPDHRPPGAPEPDPAGAEVPEGPRYVRCPMLGCGRLHEITEL